MNSIRLLMHPKTHYRLSKNQLKNCQALVVVTLAKNKIKLTNDDITNLIEAGWWSAAFVSSAEAMLQSTSFQKKILTLEVNR